MIVLCSLSLHRPADDHEQAARCTHPGAALPCQRLVCLQHRNVLYVGQKLCLPWTHAATGKLGAHRRSNTRTEPSAETEAKTPTPPHAMSYTSLSCAISCVSTTPRCGRSSRGQTSVGRQQLSGSLALLCYKPARHAIAWDSAPITQHPLTGSHSRDDNTEQAAGLLSRLSVHKPSPSPRCPRSCRSCRSRRCPGAWGPSHSSRTTSAARRTRCSCSAAQRH